MSEPRPAVPSDVKRQLRQEAGFGCCVCGNPIFEYHHIIPYATEAHFRPQDMMILCPNHHEAAREKGALDEIEQRSNKKIPFNILNECASGQLIVKQTDTLVDLGGHTFHAGEGDLLRINGESTISVRLSDRGTLLLSLVLRDASDKVVVEIKDNEWLSGDEMPWDIRFEHRKLTINSAPYQISLDVDSGSNPIAVRGTIWGGGKLLKIDSKGLHVDQAHFIGSGRVNAVIEMDSQTTGFRLVSQGAIRRNSMCQCGSGQRFKKCHGLKR